MYKNVVGPPLLMRTVVHQISKTVDQRFLSPENSCTPILFEIIERQFSSPENRGEHNPENCSSPPVLFKTADQRIPSPENSCAQILFKILERQFSYPENRSEHSPDNSKTLVPF